MRFHEQVHGVYFDDLDYFGVLHNARYLLLCERTIGSFWQRLGLGGPLAAAQEPDQLHMVRVNTLEYLSPVRGTGEVRVRVWVEKLGTTSLTFAMRVLPMDHDHEHARGSRVVVRVDGTTNRPVPWSDDFRARLAPFRADLG